MNESSTTSRNRRTLYSSLGFILGISAPVAWILIRIIFFPEPGLSFWRQIVTDITKSGQNIALYVYMGVGTALVMSFLGYIIGKATASRKPPGRPDATGVQVRPPSAETAALPAAAASAR